MGSISFQSSSIWMEPGRGGSKPGQGKLFAQLQSMPNDLRLLRQPLANFAWSHKYHGQSKVFLAWPYSWQSTLQAESWHRWSQMRFSKFRLFKHYSTCPHEVSHIFPQRSFTEPPKQERLEAQYASVSKTTSLVAVVSSYWCSWGLLLWVEPWYLHQWYGCPITSYHVSPGAGWVPRIWWLSSAGDTHWGMRRLWEFLRYGQVNKMNVLHYEYIIHIPHHYTTQTYCEFSLRYSRQHSRWKAQTMFQRIPSFQRELRDGRWESAIASFL